MAVARVQSANRRALSASYITPLPPPSPLRAASSPPCRFVSLRAASPFEFPRDGLALRRSADLRPSLMAAFGATPNFIVLPEARLFRQLEIQSCLLDTLTRLQPRIVHESWANVAIYCYCYPLIFRSYLCCTQTLNPNPNYKLTNPRAAAVHSRHPRPVDLVSARRLAAGGFGAARPPATLASSTITTTSGSGAGAAGAAGAGGGLRAGRRRGRWEWRRRRRRGRGRGRRRGGPSRPRAVFRLAARLG